MICICNMYLQNVFIMCIYCIHLSIYHCEKKSCNCDNQDNYVSLELIIVLFFITEILNCHHKQCSNQKAIIMIVVVFMSRDNDNRFCTYMRLRFLLFDTLQIEMHLRNNWLQQTRMISYCALSLK